MEDRPRAARCSEEAKLFSATNPLSARARALLDSRIIIHSATRCALRYKTIPHRCTRRNEIVFWQEREKHENRKGKKRNGYFTFCTRGVLSSCLSSKGIRKKRIYTLPAILYLVSWRKLPFIFRQRDVIALSERTRGFQGKYKETGAARVFEKMIADEARIRRAYVFDIRQRESKEELAFISGIPKLLCLCWEKQSETKRSNRRKKKNKECGVKKIWYVRKKRDLISTKFDINIDKRYYV